MMTKHSYLAIWALFLCAAIGYAASFALKMIEHPEWNVPFGILSDQLKYFTYWTNILLLMLSGYMAFSRRFIPDSMLAAVTLWMIVVSLVWHGLLSDGRERVGLDLISDSFGHTVNPILLILIWIGLAPKAALTWRDPLIWLLWPLTYVSVVLVRGILTGFYPYFFLDLPELGATGFAMWVIRFLIAFYIGGLGLVALGKLLHRLFGNR